MRIAGIIAEYDPFHKGHAAHIAATRAENGGNATHIVTVISGNFTQRGEPALVDKFHRAEMALANGADLVAEIPVPWAMAPAESFAAGGVATLKALGCVDVLSFGSECGNVETLQALANLPQHKDYPTALRQALSTGLPYAAAGQMAACSLVGEDTAKHLATPNNTLGIEYIRAAMLQQADWGYFTLQRQGALHNENAPNQGFASASLIRGLIRENKLTDTLPYLPAESAMVLENAFNGGHIATCPLNLEISLLAHLRRMQEEDFLHLPWLSEGIENRLYSVARTSKTYTDLLAESKTRRYPMARLRRVLWSALLGVSAEDCAGLPPYIRVLGMNARGKEILNAASPSLPILTRTAQLKNLDERCNRIFSLECTATDLHALCMPHPYSCGRDHTEKLIIK